MEWISFNYETPKFIELKENNMGGFYIICIESHEFKGHKFKSGDMGYHQSDYPHYATKWRKATEKEIMDHKIKWAKILDKNKPK